MSKNIIDQTAQESNTLISKDGGTSCSIDDKTKKSTKPKSKQKKEITVKRTEFDEPESSILAFTDEDKDAELKKPTKKLTEEEKKEEKERMVKVKARRAIIQANKDKAVLELSKTYYYVTVGAKVRILRIVHCPIGGQLLCFFSLPEFVNLLRHEPHIEMALSDNGTFSYDSTAVAWLNSTLVTTYIKTVFEPQEAPLSCVTFPQRPKDLCFNVWRGFSAKKVNFNSNDRGLLFYLNHIKEIICDNNEACFTYLIKYFAHMVQKPEKKPRAAIIVKGGMGSGKGLFVEPLLAMVKSHSAITERAEDVVGKFNGVLECCLLLCLNEAFVGRKEAADVMKSVSESKLMRVERKGQDVIFMRSCLRCILLSNHDFILNIEKDDRRYVYLLASNKRQKDHNYFEQLALYIQNDDFVDTLFSYLLSIDIDGFLPDKLPQTEELLRQQGQCLDLYDSFVLNMLKEEINCVASRWAYRVSNGELLQCLDDFNKLKRMPVYGCPTTRITEALKKVGVICKKINISKSDENGNRIKTTRRIKEFPDVYTCRKLFQKNILNFDFKASDGESSEEDDETFVESDKVYIENGSTAPNKYTA